MVPQGSETFDLLTWRKNRDSQRVNTRNTLARLDNAEKQLVAEFKLTQPELALSTNTTAEPVESLLTAVPNMVDRFRRATAEIQNILAQEQAEQQRLATEERLRREAEAREKERVRQRQMMITWAAVILAIVLIVVIFAITRSGQ